MPDALADWRLFLIGTTLGMTSLLVSAYGMVSPRWLRWLLFASVIFLAGRYIAMAGFAISGDGERVWPLRRFWLASSVSLTLPGLIALDQLVRHPLMTPKKLIRSLAPLFAAYAVVILFGQFELASHPFVGDYPRLIGWARVAIIVIQSGFVLGFAWLGMSIIRRLPIPRIRPAIVGLIAAYAYLGLDGLLVSVERWYFRPFLFSEMAAIGALWYAFHTAQETAGG